MGPSAATRIDRLRAFRGVHLTVVTTKAELDPMSRTYLSQCALACLFLLQPTIVLSDDGMSTSSRSVGKTEPPPRPNILLILTDDQGWPTLECYGGDKVATPHLDRLAKQGARFTDAYVTSQCTPTRATLLTGQYTARHGLWHVISWYGYPWARMTEPSFSENLPRRVFTIAKGLRRAGYATGMMGKWHLTSNEDGHYMGLNPAAATHYGFDYAPPVLNKEEFRPGEDRGVEELTDQAIAFIDRNRDRPWFCFLSHHMIHGPVVAKEALVEKYRRLGYDDEGPYRAVYLAGLEHIDRSVGRLMAALDKLDEADETLVIFLSDNGGIDERYAFENVTPHPRQPTFSPDMREYDNTPLRAGKGSIYEGGVRVPMVVRWPGYVSKGMVIETPVHAVDLMATALDLAGARAPSDHPLDGCSLKTLLLTGKDEALEQRPVFQYYPFYDLLWGLTPSASIRRGDYKLIEFFGDRVGADGRYVSGHHLELYDLRTDIAETRNLTQTRADLTSELQSELHRWMQGIGVETPSVNPHHEPSRAFEKTRDKPDWLSQRH